MKRYHIFLIFFLLSTFIFSQTIKFRAVSAGFAPTESEYKPIFFKDNSLIILYIDEKKTNNFQ